MSRKSPRRGSGGAPPHGNPAQLWQTAVAAYENGRPKQARKALKPLLGHPAADGYTFLLAGLVDAELADWAGAETHLRKAVKALPGNADVWLALGNAYHGLGRLEEATDAFKAATSRAPGNPQAWNNLAVVNEDMGRLRDALDCYERALEAAPGFPQALRGRATALARLRWFDQAKQAYQTLLAAQPDDNALRLEYAEFLEQANRPDEAAEYLPDVGVLQGKHADARAEFLRAQLLIRRGELDTALQGVRRARQRTREDFLGYREGQILDRQGQYGEAMAAFQRANRARAGGHDFQRLLKQPVEDYLRHKLEAGVEVPGAPDGPDPGASKRLVVVTGLPRSGTTLLDRMLNAHPDVQVLEELEGLRMAESAFAEGAAPEEARRVYWDFVGRHVSLGEAPVVVDKNPLHVMHLDVLPRLFPAARVVFVLRHPYDAALSCYMQDFSPGPVTARFTDLTATAALCALFLKLMRQFESACPEQVTRVHYEDLVGGFEQQVRRILATMDLEWHDDIRGYAGIAARSAPIMTASYEQVTRPLYRTSLERWRHYEQWLGPFHRELGGLLAELGYTDGPPDGASS